MREIRWWERDCVAVYDANSASFITRGRGVEKLSFRFLVARNVLYDACESQEMRL